MKKKNLLLLVLITLFILLFIFIKIKPIIYIDSIVYKFIINFKSDTLTSFFKLITKLGTFKMTFIIGCILLLMLRKKTYFILPFTSIFIKLINIFGKAITNRPRPNILRLISINESSFPSGHSMLSITIYGLLIYIIYSNIYKNSVKWILIILLCLIIILIGISRIYLGVHYFTDIVGGYILGIIYLLVITNYIKLRDD